MATLRELPDPHADALSWRVKYGVLQWSYVFERHGYWHDCDGNSRVFGETPERLVLWTELYLNPTV